MPHCQIRPKQSFKENSILGLARLTGHNPSRPVSAKGEMSLKIKPGMAFGTGHHETTFLMLKHLINQELKIITIYTPLLRIIYLNYQL